MKPRHPEPNVIVVAIYILEVPCTADTGTAEAVVRRRVYTAIPW